MSVNSTICYPNTVEGICNRVSTLLNDVERGHENERWSKKFIQSLVVDALWMMASLKPDLFTEEITFDLDSSVCGQRLPDDCDKLVEFVCVVDKKTGRQMPIGDGNYDTIQSSSYYPAPCSRKCRGGEFSGITQFQFAQSKSNVRSFVVSPTPPEGSDLEVRALCVSINKLIEEDGLETEMPSELRPWVLPIVELVLSMALSMDRDNPNLLAISQMHLNAFVSLSNIALASVQPLFDSATGGP